MVAGGGGGGGMSGGGPSQSAPRYDATAEYQAGLYLKKQSRARLNLNIVEELGSQALKTAPLRCGNYFRWIPTIDPAPYF